MTNASTCCSVLLATLLGVLSAAQGVEVRQLTPPYLHSEGPSWDSVHGALLFVDIAAYTLHSFNPVTGADHWLTLDGPVSPAILLRDGSLALGVGRTLRHLDWAASNFSSAPATPPTLLASVESDMPGNRFNDGNVDSLGRLWIGTVGSAKSSLFRFVVEGNNSANVTRALHPVTNSNGLVFNREETRMYYIDTPTRRVDVFDYNLAEGTISNRTTAFDLAAHNVTGYPDGMAIDADDNLWVACYGGGQVIQVDPRSGRLLRRVAIPASQVTAVALGGPAGDTLYVTSMRVGLTDAQLAEEPAAGAVFEVTGLGCRPQRKP